MLHRYLNEFPSRWNTHALAPSAKLNRRQLSFSSSQRMRHQRAIRCNEAETLDLALRQKHPIEWIACFRLRCDRRKRVVFVDGDDRDPKIIKQLWQGGQARPQPELAQSPLDRNLPETGRAQMMLVIRIFQQSLYAIWQAGHAALDQDK